MLQPGPDFELTFGVSESSAESKSRDIWESSVLCRTCENYGVEVVTNFHDATPSHDKNCWSAKVGFELCKL